MVLFNTSAPLVRRRQADMFDVVDQAPSVKPARAFILVTVAIVIVLVAIAGYVLLNRVPPTAGGEISAVWLYQPLPPQTADGSPAPRGNGLLLLAPIKIRNLSTKPLSVMDLSAVIRIGDTDYKSYAASSPDFDKVFTYYPDLDAYRKPILLVHSEIPPGGETEGLAIFNFALAEDQWSKASTFFVDVTFDDTPYVLHLAWPTFPAHQHIAAVQAPVVPQAPPEKPPAP
ncbi:MAG TPA: hypothetical protein VE178_16740 [Silvibacterium sp.]|jgi:hypothetical protein|nr:hypothetical protein [Silvibacterium sp.]